MAVMLVATVFTNRSLVIEQKTSANQYRYTLALEAAEAGLEWATAMLNKGQRINASCVDTSASGALRFRQKYLSIDADTGNVTPNAGVVHAACVANQTGTGWTCSCRGRHCAFACGHDTRQRLSAQLCRGLRGQPDVGDGAGLAWLHQPVTTDSCSGDAAATVSVTLGPFPAWPRHRPHR